MQTRLSSIRLRLAIATPLALALAALCFASPTPAMAGQGRALWVSEGSSNGAFLGVGTEEEVDHEEGGARITFLVDGSAADDAGLQTGDIIVDFDGRAIRGPAGLTRALGKRESGDSVQLTFLRDGREETVEIELGRRTGVVTLHGDGNESIFVSPLGRGRGQGYSVNCADEQCSFGCQGDDCDGLFRVCDDDDCPSVFSFGGGNRPMLGVQITSITDDLRQHLGGSAGAGVLIGEVVEDSPAQAAGIEVGDLILSVDGSEVERAGDLRRTLRGSWGETLEIELLRDGRAQRLDVTMPEQPERRFMRPQSYRVRPGA